MYIDVNVGYVNESGIEYIEIILNGNVTKIALHLISGRSVEVEGELARRILEYARMNKVQFMSKLLNPVGLNGETQ